MKSKVYHSLFNERSFCHSSLRLFNVYVENITWNAGGMVHVTPINFLVKRTVCHSSGCLCWKYYVERWWDAACDTTGVHMYRML